MKKLTLLLTVLIQAAVLQAQDRGLGNPNSIYIEKGTFSAGINGAYRSFNAADGMSILGLISNTDGKLSLLSLDAHADWFFRDNLSLVATLGYSNTGVDSNSLKLTELLDMSNKHTRSEKYSGSIGVRKYIPLFNSKILAIFGEGRLGGSRGYSKTYAVTERGKEGSYTDLYSVSLGVIAGASVFVNDRLAVQISLPVAEIGYDWEKQTEAQVKESSLTGLTLSKKSNLLGIEIGTIFCF